MTQGHTLSGPPNPFQSLFRIVILIAATIGGFFLLAASAAFAVFVLLGLVILGVIIFTVLWVKAKITGTPIMAAFVSKSARQQFDAFHAMQKETAENKSSPQANSPQDGPIIDAHETPDGWSVDSE